MKIVSTVVKRFERYFHGIFRFSGLKLISNILRFFCHVNNFSLTCIFFILLHFRVYEPQVIITFHLTLGLKTGKLLFMFCFCIRVGSQRKDQEAMSIMPVECSFYIQTEAQVERI